MAQSISQTLADMRISLSILKDKTVRYNAQGFEIRKFEPMGEPIERPAYPDDSYERMLSRFSHEDNFDPS